MERLAVPARPRAPVPSTNASQCASPDSRLGQEVIWGQWPCHTFTHCVTVLTERHARTLYELDDEPLLPVVDCTLAGVAHLCSSCHRAAVRKLGRDVVDCGRSRAAQ